MNAVALLQLVKEFKHNKSLQPCMFVPWHFGSQCCEQLFRTSRSMTSTYLTAVNFSMKELLQKLTRIEILNNIKKDLSNVQTADSEGISRETYNPLFCFPRDEKHSRNYLDKSTYINTPLVEEFNFFNDSNIKNILNKSLIDAKQKAARLEIPIFEAATEQPLFMNKSNEYTKLFDDLLHTDDCNTDKIEDKINTPIEELNDAITQELSDNLCKDLGNISTYGNFGETLHLKDFTESSLFLNKINSQGTASVDNSPFVQITLENSKKMVIRKSSLCWFLDQKNCRISNDRLKRFIPSKIPSIPKSFDVNLMEKSRKKSKINYSASTSKLIHKKQNNEFKKNKKQPYTSLSTLSFDESSGSTTQIPSYADSSVSSESDMLKKYPDVEINQVESCSSLNIKFENEKYYAVYYDTGWYIGRVLEIMEDKCKVKFLKADLDNFFWPKNNEVHDVSLSFIFYGPIYLVGSYPFQLKRFDKLNIHNIYKKLKKDNF